MNPGKLMDAVRVYDPMENLRKDLRPSLGDSAKRAQPLKRNLETHFAFAKDGGSLERATERCVGVGACRNTVAA